MNKIQIFLCCALLLSLSVEAENSEKSDGVAVKDPELIYKILKHVFRLPSFFTDLFDKKSFKITQPRDPKMWKNISKTLECTAVAYLRNYNKTVELKFKQMKDIPYLVDYSKVGVVCNSKKENVKFNSNTTLPNEYRISNLIRGQNNFLNYFPDLALRVSRVPSSIVIFVNEYIGKLVSIDKYKADEEKLRTIFTKIYNAILFLEQKGFIYMNLIPSNILIDRNGEAYLTNIGSSYPYELLKTQEICDRANEYDPPEFMNKNTTTLDWNRIQKWNFCRLAYSMVCGENSETNKAYEVWIKQEKSFIEYFKCRKYKHVSKDFVHLMDSCLLKPDRVSLNSSFADLKMEKWLRKN